MQLAPQEYRLITDNRLKVAEYRFYWIVGKSLILLLLALLTMIIYGLNQGSDFSFWWLFGLPVALFVALFWKSFPAFCRCPDCKKKMVSRSKTGKVTKSHKFFDEIGPTRHYLVCDQCKLYLFLGESTSGGG